MNKTTNYIDNFDQTAENENGIEGRYNFNHGTIRQQVLQTIVIFLWERLLSFISITTFQERGNNFSLGKKAKTQETTFQPQDLSNDLNYAHVTRSREIYTPFAFPMNLSLS